MNGRVVQIVPANDWQARVRFRGDTGETLLPLICWALNEDGTIDGVVDTNQPPTGHPGVPDISVSLADLIEDGALDFYEYVKGGR